MAAWHHDCNGLVADFQKSGKSYSGKPLIKVENVLRIAACDGNNHYGRSVLGFNIINKVFCSTLILFVLVRRIIYLVIVIKISFVW